MQNLRKKVDALMRLALSETDEEQDRAIADIRNLLCNAEGPRQNTESIIRGILLDLGVPDHLLGHGYLVTALTLAAQDKSFINNITAGLYPAVAVKHDTTKSRAERAIRHAIEAAWDRGDTDVLYHYFGNTVSIAKGKPINSEFIARITSIVRERIEGGGNTCTSEFVPTAEPT